MKIFFRLIFVGSAALVVLEATVAQAIENINVEISMSDSDSIENFDVNQWVPPMMGFFKFKPKLITLRRGQQITWTNNSFVPHTVTADPRLAKDPASVMLPPGAAPFHSGSFGPFKKYTHVFNVAGDYKYFCIPHETHGMVGYIRVEP